jgi:hypothetical protein
VTSVTEFLFSFRGFTPALGVGILSMFILTVTIAARYGFHLTGAWRWIYVVGAVATDARKQGGAPFSQGGSAF